MHTHTYRLIRRREDRAMQAALFLALAVLGAAIVLLCALVTAGVTPQ